MARACILLMDSFGIGESLDAKKYGDEGADTFGHIFQACHDGKCDTTFRKGPLVLPNLARLGLYHAHMASTAKKTFPLTQLKTPIGAYGYAVETSHGKDTPSGHWEIAGVPVLFDWGYFPDNKNCFPDALINNFIKQAGLLGVLGLKHASGTVILEELGQAHIDSGKPIVYTSADSVFQIAADETHFGLERLYKVCEIARKCVDEYDIGRVIARPFVKKEGKFIRTANRRDYATPPPEPTLLDKLKTVKREVIAIGKIADIYAHKGITKEINADGNMALFDSTIAEMKKAPEGSLVFTNFVDFDSKYGHRRNVAGYAKALEDFDKRLPELETILKQEDMVIIAADHGCDPTMPGSDHTREHIPVLAFGPVVLSQFIGRRDSFADIGQTIALHLGIEPISAGVGF